METAMPTELRHLLFQPAEVLDAVREYHRRFSTPLPAGRVMQCGLDEAEAAAGRTCFRIVLATPSTKVAAPGKPAEDTRREIVIEGHVLAAALILYCRDRRIPLPVAASKQLRHFGDQVCLVTTLGAKGDKLPQLC
jgi:hypothetical protein